MRTIRVVAALICREHTVLAACRNYGPYAGKWEFPGGKIEPGETPQQALAREICEELDEKIIVGARLMTREYDYPDFHLSMDCFWCRQKDPYDHAHLSSHSRLRWISLEKEEEIDWIEADRLIYEIALKTCKQGDRP